MNGSQPRIGSLCTGYGGLDLAAQAVFGGHLAWFAEIEPAAVTVLEHHHPGTPNHGDLTTTDWADVEPVDVLTAGWPCQPFSLAGKRKGALDERAIWPHVARAIRALRPSYVVLENVAAIAAAGELARAAGDLAALGYLGSWRSVRASDVGAPHRRERIFIAAAVQDPDRAAGREWRFAAPGQAEGGRARAHAGRRGRAPAAHPGGPRLEGPLSQVAVPVGQRAAANGQGTAVAEHRGVAANPNSDRREGGAQRDRRPVEPGQPAPLGGDSAGRVLDWAGYARAIRRWERVLGRPAPAPTVLGRTGKPKLSPLFVEWLMGLPEGHITGVPGLTPNQQLKLCGNGVVPQQAEHAIRSMTAHLAPEVAA